MSRKRWTWNTEKKASIVLKSFNKKNEDVDKLKQEHEEEKELIVKKTIESIKSKK